MATKTRKKPFVKLQCSACKSVNYFTRKSLQRKRGESKLEMQKFCSSCRKHAVHKEAKK
ncbi:MAG: 50S ribosomal protein L33 [Candidatus Yanofskybacteria bacterium]|nr:50S ribosomal protein L33 [Candidatus Yanofskybacteria bacterium]